MSMCKKDLMQITRQMGADGVDERLSTFHRRVHTLVHAKAE